MFKVLMLKEYYHIPQALTLLKAGERNSGWMRWSWRRRQELEEEEQSRQEKKSKEV